MSAVMWVVVGFIASNGLIVALTWRASIHGDWTLCTRVVGAVMVVGVGLAVWLVVYVGTHPESEPKCPPGTVVAYYDPPSKASAWPYCRATS